MEEEDLSQRLTETTNQLWTRARNLGRQNTTFWRRSSGRSRPEKEKSSETRVKQVEEEKNELAEKARSFEARVKLVEDQKKELEELEMTEKKRGFWSRMKRVKTGQTKVDKKKRKKKEKTENEQKVEIINNNNFIYM